MPKALKRSSGSRRRKPSSRLRGRSRSGAAEARRKREPGTLARIHQVRREMELEKRRLGLSEVEYLDYLAKKNRHLTAGLR